VEDKSTLKLERDIARVRERTGVEVLQLRSDAAHIRAAVRDLGRSRTTWAVMFTAAAALGVVAGLRNRRQQR
jgi:hypothetical protein